MLTMSWLVPTLLNPEVISVCVRPDIKVYDDSCPNIIVKYQLSTKWLPKKKIINKIQDKSPTVNKDQKKVLNIVGLTKKFRAIHFRFEFFHMVNTATLAKINPRTTPLAALNQDFQPEETHKVNPEKKWIPWKAYSYKRKSIKRALFYSNQELHRNGKELKQLT